MIAKRSTIVVALLLILLLPSASESAPQTASGVTAQDIIDDVRWLFDESNSDSGKLLNDTYILSWINMGLVDIASRSMCLQESEDVSLTSGTTKYSLSSSYIVVDSVVYNNAEDDSGNTTTGKRKGVKKGSFQMVGEKTGVTGEPQSWVDWNGAIVVDPIPSQAHNNGVLTVNLYTLPSSVSSSSAIPTPAVYDNSLIYFTLSHAFRMGRDLNMAEYYNKLYESEMQRTMILFNKPSQEPEDVGKP